MIGTSPIEQSDQSVTHGLEKRFIPGQIADAAIREDLSRRVIRRLPR
jgi:hypothetical protein